jgi:hypothetical protein
MHTGKEGSDLMIRIGQKHNHISTKHTNTRKDGLVCTTALFLFFIEESVLITIREQSVDRKDVH